MTEEEAKTKRCPLATVALFFRGGEAAAAPSASAGVMSFAKPADLSTLSPNLKEMTSCIASRCMMWVEDGSWNFDDDPDHPTFVKSGKGYCGFHDAHGRGAVP